ncbi:MAG: quinolinate synthase NadA [Desulfomonilia bacterium]
MTKEEARKTIIEKKQELGKRLIILGHHYQSDEVIAYADYVGDSLELARKASQVEEADHIVFCGVFFMAESAAILAPEKSVYIPDFSAGCPLADMAEPGSVQKAWEIIKKTVLSVVPVTYVNSSARIKAFCGRHGGIVCTSGNAQRIFEWALERADRIFFMPDMNLGRNTARQMGISGDQIVLWDPEKEQGGLESDELVRARVVLWKGWCPVHWPKFTPKDVRVLKEKHPGLEVIVHPESDPQTVEASDQSGSTARILEAVRATPPGGRLAIGTEANMVKRAARENPWLTIVPLREVYCDEMAKITVEKLAQVLLHLNDDTFRVTVEQDVARHALSALERMLRV